MDVKYRPPINDKEECEYLERNYLRCLKEKSKKDEVDLMKCKVENILWFQTECSKRYALYENPATLREIFIQQKSEEVNPKKAILKKK